MSTTQATIRAGRYPTLAEIKRETLHPVDAWWTVLFIDPIAIRLLWLLVRVWPGVTPNAVTFASLVAGLAAGYAFFTGHLIWGALLYQFSYLLDCVDGKVARLRGLVSPLGAFWDGLANNMVFVACVLGLMGALTEIEWMPYVGASLLWVWALHIYVGHYLPAAIPGMWVKFTPEEGGWLHRHRLFYPLTSPDKQALVFTLAPLSGFPVVGMFFILVVDVPLLAAKLLRIYRNSETRLDTSRSLVQPED